MCGALTLAAKALRSEGYLFDMCAKLAAHLAWASAIVGGPTGDFVHALLIPISPRSPGNWATGNADLENDLRCLRDRLGPVGLPWVFGIDMNGTPGSHRAALAMEVAGLERAKPFGVASGSWRS